MTIQKNYGKPYRAREDLQERISAVQEVIAFLRDSHLPLDRKKRMLHHAVWEVSIALGDSRPEFRSAGFLKQTEGTKTQREHVYKRQRIVEDILRNEEPLDAIVKRIVHCMVTKDEHEKLDDIPDKNLDGWARYRAAGIEVFSCAGDEPMNVDF
jgi:hypothetical protein